MLTLTDVLTAEDCTRVRQGLDEIAFRDGRETAGSTARKVKSNRQAAFDDPRTRALAAFVREALERHPVFAAYARPARWSRLLFSRYGEGDAYGTHTDDAILPCEAGGRMRGDLSFTLFLSEPETYEGGALVVDGLDGEREARPAAGTAILYSTGQLHRVEPVVRGERIAAVGWIQSRVRRADQRELLFDLARVRASLGESEARLTLDKSIGNLLRMWAET